MEDGIRRPIVARRRAVLRLARRKRTATGTLTAVLAGTLALTAMAWAGATTATAAPSCAVGSSVDVVAHPDDDLFFQNPDVQHDIARGACVATVYATSGDDGRGTTYSRARERGVEAAYAAMAGVANSWTTTTTTVAGHGITTAVLAAAPRVQLFFLRLPDGNMDGSGFRATGYASLQQLYQGRISSLRTADSSAQSYTVSSLVQTLGGLITSTGATVIRTLDDQGTYGDGDHSDHYTIAYLTARAQATTAPGASLIGYLGYPTAGLPANLTASDVAAKQATYLIYAPYDSQECVTLAACSAGPEGAWLLRQHTTADLYQSAGSGNVPGDLATTATATASSQNVSTGQTAAKAIDGVADGYPGNYTNEWATTGGRAGSWLQLAWATPVTLDHVVLFDRPNTDDQITGAALAFSDGSTVSVLPLDNAGAAVTVSFPARVTTSLRLTVTSVSSTTSNVGLAELEAFGPASGSTPPPTSTPTPSPTPTPTPTPTPSGDLALAATASASSQNTSTGQTAAKAIDGVIDGYPGDYTKEWATIGGRTGSWLQLTWPSTVTIGRVVLYDRPDLDDQILAATLTFSDGSTVSVPALDNAGGALTVTFTPRATTSVQLTITKVSGTTLNIGLSELQAWAA